MKLSPAQTRLLEALAEGRKLNSYPDMGSFDPGGFRWEDYGERQPNSRTVWKLYDEGMLDIQRRRLGVFTGVPVTITAKGREAIK